MIASIEFEITLSAIAGAGWYRRGEQLQGELEFTFRGETTTVGAGSSVNIPANAPHMFKNTSGSTVHMLCFCTPAGQEEFFIAVGSPLETRISPPPKLDKAGMEERMKKAKALAPKYRTELLKL